MLSGGRSKCTAAQICSSRGPLATIFCLGLESGYGRDFKTFENSRRRKVIIPLRPRGTTIVHEIPRKTPIPAKLIIPNDTDVAALMWRRSRPILIFRICCSSLAMSKISLAAPGNTFSYFSNCCACGIGHEYSSTRVGHADAYGNQQDSCGESTLEDLCPSGKSSARSVNLFCELSRSPLLWICFDSFTEVLWRSYSLQF